MAHRQNLPPHKSRTRDPRAIGYGTYHLTDITTNTIVAGERMDIDDVERYLLKG